MTEAKDCLWATETGAQCGDGMRGEETSRRGWRVPRSTELARRESEALAKHANSQYALMCHHVYKHLNLLNYEIMNWVGNS